LDKITICLTYFKSLSLANLEAALYSVRQQDLPRVGYIVVVDNNTDDSAESIQGVIDRLNFPVPVRLISYKHGDPNKTHSWSTNVAIRQATTEWVLFTRADYLLDFNILLQFVGVIASKPKDWDGFITGRVYHLHLDIAACNTVNWQYDSHRLLTLPGKAEDYTLIDTGVYAVCRSAFERVGGMNENLTAWGHAQTHFQWKLYKSGTEFVEIPDLFFYHPAHGGMKDINVAHEQLQREGIDIKELWRRYEGEQPYK